MAPSLINTIGLAAATYATLASAAKSYTVSDVYNSTNFFDRFGHFVSTLGGDISVVDPTGGYVQYQDRLSAEALGLISIDGDEVYIGPETSLTYDPNGYGRKSVRLEGLTTYNHGLFIADFTYLPKPTCGAWPAFWMFGNPWPTKGEIDIMENWNDLEFNRNTAHTDNPSVVGDCTIKSSDMTASVIEAPNCYDYAPGQYSNQGCSADSYGVPFGLSDGGVYALEWTSDYLKIWSWTRLLAPIDIQQGTPLPLTWGTPDYMIQDCNIDKAFQDMKLVFNIDFCGVAGVSGIWDSCAASTGYASCTEYVAGNPDAFASSYFKVADIKVYQETEDVVKPSSSTSSSAVSTSSTTSTSLTSTTTSFSSSSSAVTATSSSSSSAVTSSSASSFSATASATITSEAPGSNNDQAVTSTLPDPSSSAKNSTSDTVTVSTVGSSSPPSPDSSVSLTLTASETASSATAAITSHEASDTLGSHYPTTVPVTSSIPTYSYSNTSATAAATSSASYPFTNTSTVSITSSYSGTAPASSAQLTHPASETTSSGYPVDSYSSTSAATTAASSPATYVASDAASGSSTAAFDTSSETASATVATSDVEEYTTSTVWTTRVQTVTSCAPTITNCPAGSGHEIVVTETIPAYVTVCPVTTATKGASSQLTTPSSNTAESSSPSSPAVSTPAEVNPTVTSTPGASSAGSVDVPGSNSSGSSSTGVVVYPEGSNTATGHETTSTEGTTTTTSTVRVPVTLTVKGSSTFHVGHTPLPTQRVTFTALPSAVFSTLSSGYGNATKPSSSSTTAGGPKGSSTGLVPHGGSGGGGFGSGVVEVNGGARAGVTGFGFVAVVGVFAFLW